MVIGKHNIKILSDNLKTVLLAGTVANSLDHGISQNAVFLLTQLGDPEWCHNLLG